eukprot:scaffold86480_cov27-Tisochrysis_lutea.AAC.2
MNLTKLSALCKARFASRSGAPLHVHASARARLHKRPSLVAFVITPCMPQTEFSLLSQGGVEWPRFFELIGKPSPKSLNVDSPPALATACRLIMEASSEDFRW